MTTTETPPVERIALSAREAATALGISYHTVSSLIKKGQIPSFFVGNHRHVSVDVLREVARRWAESGTRLDPYSPEGGAA